MAFKKTVGAAGIIHPSQAEAKLSFPFFDLGILSSETFYPDPFADGKGKLFRAKRDFQDKWIPAISIETKSGSLNSLSSCASAANALAKVENEYADGFISSDHIDYRRLAASWSASVTKFKLVQLQEAAAGRVVIMVYDKKPPLKTLPRLERPKVLWCVYGDSDWLAFNQFRLHARFGIQSSFIIKGHHLHANGGATLH